MGNANLITLQKARDFSQKMNATFEFIRQNFKSMMKALLFIAGPSILIASVLLGTLLSDSLSMLTGAGENPEQTANHFMSVSFWLEIILLMGFFLVSTVMTISAVNNYIILYDEKKTTQIEVDEVWTRVRGSFWQYLGTTLMLFFLFMLVYIGLLIFSALAVAASPILFFFAFLGILAVLVYMVIGASMTYFIRSYEKRDFFDALARSFRLVKGEWWSTFLFAFVLGFIMYTISLLCIMPFYVLMVLETINNVEATSSVSPSKTAQWIWQAFFVVSYAVGMISNLLAFVGISFQYFSLVESKEARGLISEIESIGKSSAEKTHEEHY